MEFDYMCAMEWVWCQNEPTPVYFAFSDVDHPSNVVLVGRDINRLTFNFNDIVRNQAEDRLPRCPKPKFRLIENFEKDFEDFVRSTLTQKRGIWDVRVGTSDPQCFTFLQQKILDSVLFKVKMWWPTKTDCVTKAIQNAMEYGVEK